ncbi:hypothetical protein A2774_04225 [Candidatus Roizmanbacteria bacterium RIFCSPHIGHO2_01_FULL_39_12c]|uniref:Uncharacterized protein n=1 Tax=Candidatus Roizmanbacteria bacterium RIFCSPHIGHO2_01_FULL_39_12c TaxID=1802031 RepID=A0A1F7GEV4_9BACT|nr:MAG: hypothetical protein A2774_04225 [Candidatus Roizmanbacteria bacterium RIFCSPHIGHO2_01_FULL_39_12c]OGK48099.1 MAG: hypothetical protein A2963_04040 [Candidatus Roizmanbacteria bacterium RIFCSPLOWO2_01_FULL_40_13]
MDKQDSIEEQLYQYLGRRINREEKNATLISAYKLSEEEINKIKKSFPEIKNYKLSNIIQTEIISGFMLKFGSYIMDFSLAGRLKNLHKLFYEIA